jgi:hypothetical protein
VNAFPALTAVLEDEMQHCRLIKNNRKRGPDV